MAHPVRMPKPGQMTEECTITRWYKAEGDPVRRGDVLFEIETDKATMDVEAFDEGVLLRRLFGEGETVPVNTICAYIGEPGEAIPAESPPAALPVSQPTGLASAPPEPSQPSPLVSPQPSPAGPPTAREPAPHGPAPVSPAPPGSTTPPVSPEPIPTAAPAPIPEPPSAVGPTPGQPGIEVPTGPARPTRPPASGPAARAALAGLPGIPEREAVPEAIERPPTRRPAAPRPVGSAAGVSPRAARLASARGVDLSRLVGSGPGGRVVERDVLAAIAAGLGGPAGAPSPMPTPAVPSVPSGQPSPVDAGAVGSLVDEEAPRPLSRMRRVLAERLTSGWATTPQFSVTVAADVTPLVGLRAELRSAGHDLSLADFILAATAQTLPEYPDLNARTDGVLLWPRRRIHLGLAVAVPGGLLVPVIRDADRLSLLEIQAVAARLIGAARAGTLGPDELTGSTFTVASLGMLGVESFEAIVNPGEAAILAVGSASPEVVVVGEGIGVRTILRLTLSADHRIVDGELAARFLAALRRRLVDLPGWRALLDRT